MIRTVKKIAPDTRWIDIDDAYALEFWARELGVTSDKLKAAVLTAGIEAPNVKRELRKPKTI